MNASIPYQKAWFYLSMVWILIGGITHLSAIFWMMQYGEDLSIYSIIDVGFYYHTPALLWILYTPVVLRLYQQWPLISADWKIYLSYHLLLSIAFAPIARALAIFLDYSIKHMVGMEPSPPWEVVYQARFIVLGSSVRFVFCYWLAMGILIVWEYLAFRRQSAMQTTAEDANKKHLIVPQKAGKKIIDVQDILWIEADRNYVHIYTADQSFKLRQTLASLSKELDEQQFYRIHRSRIVNKNAIESFSHWRRGEYLIRLKNKKLLSSSRTFHAKVKELLTP